MFTVFVRLDVRPDRVKEFREGILANSRASLADEPGCIRFDVHRDIEQTCRFYFYEIYVDAAAFYTGHRSAPHYAQWLRVEADCVVPGSKEMRACEPLFADDIPEASAPRSARRSL